MALLIFSAVNNVTENRWLFHFVCTYHHGVYIDYDKITYWMYEYNLEKYWNTLCSFVVLDTVNNDKLLLSLVVTNLCFYLKSILVIPHKIYNRFVIIIVQVSSTLTSSWRIPSKINNKGSNTQSSKPWFTYRYRASARTYKVRKPIVS